MASNFDNVLSILVGAACAYMNRPEKQELTEKLFNIAKQHKPDMTEGEWEQVKVNMITNICLRVMGGEDGSSGHYMSTGDFTGERSDLAYEVSGHLWEALRA